MVGFMPNLPSKQYVVWVGRHPGIYDSWNEAKQQVDGYPGAQYKSFSSREDAEAAYSDGPPRVVTKRSTGTSRSDRKTTSDRPLKSSHASGQDEWVPIERRFDVAIYSDGACEPNPGSAGAGLTVYRKGSFAEAWHGHYRPDGTNNYAELAALHEALGFARRELEEGRTVAIACDSSYAIQAVTVWARKWKANGWTKKGGPIKNLDLIQRVHGRYLAIEDKVLVEHVRSHIGIEGNELADRMAMRAATGGIVTFQEFTETRDVQEILQMRSG